MKIPFEVSVDVQALARGIAGLKREEAFLVIKAIDDIVCEYEFTEKLRNHFDKILKDEANPQCLTLGDVSTESNEK